MVSAGIAGAAECQQENFANWLDHFKQEAMGAGISQQTMASALNGITYDPAIIALNEDRRWVLDANHPFRGKNFANGVYVWRLCSALAPSDARVKAHTKAEGQ